MEQNRFFSQLGTWYALSGCFHAGLAYSTMLSTLTPGWPTLVFCFFSAFFLHLALAEHDGGPCYPVFERR